MEGGKLGLLRYSDQTDVWSDMVRSGRSLSAGWTVPIVRGLFSSQHRRHVPDTGGTGWSALAAFERLVPTAGTGREEGRTLLFVISSNGSDSGGGSRNVVDVCLQ